MPVGRQPDNPAVVAGVAWVVLSGRRRRRPGRGRAVVRIPVGRRPEDLAIAGGSVWVTNAGDGTVTRLDLASGAGRPARPRRRAPARHRGRGRPAVGLQLRRRGPSVRLDARTGAVRGAPVRVGSHPRGVAAGRGEVWVANAGDGTVTRLSDGATVPAGTRSPRSRGREGIGVGCQRRRRHAPARRRDDGSGPRRARSASATIRSGSPPAARRCGARTSVTTRSRASRHERRAGARPRRARGADHEPDKVLFPERGETKLDLVRYYDAVAEPLMGAMGGRPVLLERFPEVPAVPASSRSACRRTRRPGCETTTVRPSTARPRTRSWRPTSRMWRGRSTSAASASTCGRPRPTIPSTPTSCGSTSTRSPAPPSTRRAGGRRAAGAARRARARRLPQDDRQPRPPRVRAPPAALGLLRGALRRGGGRARARAAPPRPPHRRLVEGGARRADLRRLQPERAAQDGVRRLVGTRPEGRAGVHPDPLGGARRRRSRRAHARDRPRPAGARRRPVGPASTSARASTRPAASRSGT